MRTKFALVLTFLLNLFSLNAATPAKHVVGIFCGADDNIPDAYKDQAFALGASLAQANYEMITGGARIGLMNAVANGFVSQGDGSNIQGVLPSVFKKYNVHYQEIPEANLIWTDSIHERLQVFHDKCDTLVVLPGGIGTLHELMDFFIFKQLNLEDKKIILVNPDHYWDHLLLQFKVMVENHALKQRHLDLLLVVTDVEDCMKAIQSQDTMSHSQDLNDRYWEKTQ